MSYAREPKSPPALPMSQAWRPDGNGLDAPSHQGGQGPPATAWARCSPPPRMTYASSCTRRSAPSAPWTAATQSSRPSKGHAVYRAKPPGTRWRVSEALPTRQAIATSRTVVLTHRDDPMNPSALDGQKPTSRW